MADSQATSFRIWELPEVLLYAIATFAVPQTERAAFFCHTLGLLSKQIHKSILDESRSELLWNLVLAGDYGALPNHAGKQRRSCKRLKRSPIQQVEDAHKLLRDNSEIAYFYLAELSSLAAASTASQKKAGLTRHKLCGILNEYGPNLMINKTMSSGGTFLVEVCRAKNASQMSILQCVQELLEKRGALVDLATQEASNSFLTALCVAAVRGMPRVVEYLLEKGASREIRCSARFRLYTKKNRHLRCTKATPLEFSQAMLEAEKAEGANDEELRDLRRCIQLLS